MVGMSMFNGYSFNERCVPVASAWSIVDIQVGNVLTLVGRAGNHRQDLDRDAQAGRNPRARRADALCAEARENYADSWRTKGVAAE
jgi:vanillate/3-O-methylgallate O-demethylase